MNCMGRASFALLLMLAATVVGCKSTTYGGSPTGNGPTAGAPPPQDIPPFPWPPPQWSAKCAVPVTLFAVSGRPTSFGDVADRLEDAFDACGYAKLAFYSAPGGFAIASQFEQINDDGTPKSGEDRWSHDIARVGFAELLESIFSAVVGRYRVVVFVVVDEAVPLDGPVPTEADADAWMASGLESLPPSLRSRTLGPEHRVLALIYEFERPDSDKPVVALNPSVLRAEDHLARARLRHVLGY